MLFLIQFSKPFIDTFLKLTFLFLNFLLFNDNSFFWIWADS